MWILISNGQMDATLTNLTHRLNIFEEITKNWNKMQQELATMNTKIDAMRTTQRALQTLLEGMAKQMEGLAGIVTTQGETSENVMQQAEDWGVLGETQPIFPSSMGELTSILEEPSVIRESVPINLLIALLSWPTLAQSSS